MSGKHGAPQIDFWVVARDRQIPIQATVATDPHILAAKHQQLTGRGIGLLAVRHQLLAAAQDGEPPTRKAATGELLQQLAEAVAAAGNEREAWPWADWLESAIAQIHQVHQAATTPTIQELAGWWRRLALLTANELGLGYRRAGGLLGVGYTSTRKQIAKERASLHHDDEWFRRQVPDATPQARIILREWTAAVRYAVELSGSWSPRWPMPPEQAAVVAWQQAILAVARHFAVPTTELLEATGSRTATHLRDIHAAPVATDTGVDTVELLSRAAAVLGGLLPEAGEPGNGRPRVATD